MDFWTDFGLLTDSFDLNFLPRKGVLSGRLLGGTAFAVKSGSNKKNRRFGLFQTTLKFLHELFGT